MLSGVIERRNDGQDERKYAYDSTDSEPIMTQPDVVGDYGQREPLTEYGLQPCPNLKSTLRQIRPA